MVLNIHQENTNCYEYRMFPVSRGHKKGCPPGSLILIFLDVVLFAEPLNASGSINKFLLPCKEGVAGRTNFNLDIPGGGTGFYNVPTGTGNLSQFILGMNALLHVFLSSGYLIWIP